MLPLGLIIQNNNIAYRCYADDTQIDAALITNGVPSYRSAVPVHRAGQGLDGLEFPTTK